MKSFFLFLFSCTLSFAAPFTEVVDEFSLPFLTPSLQNRKTAKIVLENGLRAYLISDPEASQSSACLTVEVGSFSDPEEALGLAHFMEHMVLQGTKSHPESNSFIRFISDHGGTFNAFTEDTHTSYLCSIDHKFFEEALSRLAGHLREPLFLDEALEKERYVVHEEFLKGQQSDGFRIFQVIRATSSKEHPYHKFSCGNSTSLEKVDSNYMQTFFEKNYSPEKMHLVVYSSLPLSELKEKASAFFSTIEPRSTEKTPVALASLKDSNPDTITYIKPLKKFKYLMLEWEIPQSLLEDSSKPFSLISHVFNNPHEKNLSEALKKEALAENCYSYVSTKTRARPVFTVTVSLTEKGVKNYPSVVEKIFETFALFRKEPFPSYIWEEKEHTAKLNYQYQDQIDPFAFISSQASSILEEPLSSYPKNTLFSEEPSQEKIAEALFFLRPENFRIYLMAPSLPVPCTEEEPWFKASYSMQKIAPEMIRTWKTVKPSTKVQLPPKNFFVPQDFSVIPCEKEKPSLLLKNDYGFLYYKGDNFYKTPEVSLSFSILSPEITPSSQSEVLLDLFVTNLQKKLQTTLFSAGKAGLYTYFDKGKGSLLLTISGFSEKAPFLLEKILKECKNRSVTQEEFLLIKESLLEDYYNEQKELAFSQGFQFLNICFSKEVFSSEEKIEVLHNLSYERFLEFQKKLFAKAYIQSFMLGNLTSKEAESLWLDAHHILKNEPFPKAYHPPLSTVSLKEGPYLMEKKIDLEGSASLLVIESGRETPEKKAALTILKNPLQEIFFHVLRTKQKTGYVAFSQTKKWGDNLYQILTVQSSSHEPLDLLFRFELFLEDLLENFSKEIPEERFLSSKEAVLNKVNKAHKNLKEEGALWAKAAFSEEEDFTKLEQLGKAVEELSYPDFCAFCKDLLSKTNKKRLGLLIKGTSPFTYEPYAPEEFRKITQIENRFSQEEEEKELF